MAAASRNESMKSKIRPPKTPRGEKPSVTIANQARQVELLIARCEQLRGELDDLKLIHKADLIVFDQTATQLQSRQVAYTRLLGWQDCARELLNNSYPRFPDNMTF